MPQVIFKRARWVGGVVCLLLFAGLSGCSHSAKISGKVRYQGRPVIYGAIIFIFADKSAYSTSIQHDGSYEIEGVPQGDFSIAVISRNPAAKWVTLPQQNAAPANKKEIARQAPAVNGWFPLPRRYEDSKTSGLATTVEAGNTQHDIELK